MNGDNNKLGYIEGGTFESIKNGDDRDATIAEIKMPDSFVLSARPIVVLEIDEWDKIKHSLLDAFLAGYKKSSLNYEHIYDEISKNYARQAFDEWLKRQD